MNGLFTLVFLIIIFAVLIPKLKNNMRASDSSQKKRTAAASSGRPRGFTNYRPHKDIISVSRDMGDSKNSSVLRDDRANDWLAKQLREDHRAFKATSEMFDLKIEHASHCDARFIEQFHRRNCDARGIDLANGSTIHP